MFFVLGLDSTQGLPLPLPSVISVWLIMSLKLTRFDPHAHPRAVGWIKISPNCVDDSGITSVHNGDTGDVS